MLLFPIFRCLKLDHSESSEFSLELSDRVCAIVRKIFFTLNIYLSTETEVEKTNQYEIVGKNKNENDNDNEELILHTSVKKIMLEKAVQGVRYVLSQNITTKNNDIISSSSSSLSLINSFLSYLPSNQINEILQNRKLGEINLGGISSILVLDSTKIGYLTCDAGVIDKCIEFALSTFSDDINTNSRIDKKYNDDNSKKNFNKNIDGTNNNNNNNNGNNNKNDNDQFKVSIGSKNIDNITNTSTEDEKLKLKLKTEASMTLALLANKVLKKHRST